MRHLRLAVNIDLLAELFPQPLAREPQSRIDPNPLVRHIDRIFDRLVSDLCAVIDHRPDTDRLSRAETSGKFRIALDPIVNRA